jgi:hypothetical protein
MRYLARLHQLQREGIDVEIPEEWIEACRSVDVTIAHGPMSLVFDLPRGGVGYAVWLNMTSLQRVELEIELQTDFDDQIVLLDFDGHDPICNLGWLKYYRTEVLNHIVNPYVRFRRPGQRLEGTILATGSMPIPPEYSQGMWMPLKVTFTDQFRNEFDQRAELYVDRSAKREISITPRTSSLYAPDEKPELTDAVATRDPSPPAAPESQI